MSVQVFRQKNETKVVPTAPQSLNLVRNLLGTTLGAITYLRGLFPEENFKDTTMGGLALKSLQRDITVEADELMDWLERGCFDALAKQYLKTMIFGVYLDPNDPEKLVEAYTFGFSYPDKDRWCITITSNGKEQFRLKTRGEIMKATSEMLRRLLVLTQTLRPLPEKAYITMKLFYYDEVTPADYEPPFFRPGDDEEKFYFLSSPERIKVGQIETPHHALNLQVQTAADEIQPTDEDFYGAEALVKVELEEQDMETQETDNEITERTQRVNSMSDVTAEMGKLVIEQQRLEQTSAMDVDTDTQAIIVRDDVMDDYGTSAVPTEVAEDSGENTQDLVNLLRKGIHSTKSGDIIPASPQLSELSDLTDLALSETEQRLEPCAGVLSDVDSQAVSVDFGMLEEEQAAKPLDVGSSPAMDDRNSAELNPENANAKGSLDPNETIAASKAFDSRNGREADHQACQSMVERDDQPGDNSDLESEPAVINCPCGVNEEDLDLIHCEGCGTWQHIVCIGYASSKDKRIPNAHMCFSCITERRIDGRKYDADKVAEVALFRRGLAIAWKNGVPTVSMFSKKLGTGLPLARQVVSRLEKEGFLAEERGPKSHKKVIPDDPSTYHYVVIKTRKTCGTYGRWFSKAVLQPIRGPSKPSLDEDASAGAVKDVIASNEQRPQSSGAQVNPPLPLPSTSHKPSATPGTFFQRTTRSMSSASSASSEELSLGPAHVPTTPVNTNAQQVATPVTTSKALGLEHDMKRKFLNQFDPASQRQHTGFYDTPENAERAKRKIMCIDDSDSSRSSKKRKVSVVARNIPVL